MFRRYASVVMWASHRRTGVGAIALIAVAGPVASALIGCGGGRGPVSRVSPNSRASPNIVLIQADDATFDQLTPAIMPRTERLLARGGTTFTDYITTTPQCCPSRASLITGDYGHNNGVLSNTRPYRSLRDKGNVLPVWLHRAGYRTIHVGKFLNGYEKVARPASPAPGWTGWHTVVGETAYYNYNLYGNGHAVHHGTRPVDNVTPVLNRIAVRQVAKAAPSPRPFYLELDERAPHAGGNDPYGGCSFAAIPQPRDESLSAPRLPRPPSFNEPAIGDKPPFLRRPPLTGPEMTDIARRWRCAAQSLAGLDRGVAQVYRAVRRAGELNRTVFIFTSDNGVFRGQHRLATGKIYPYQEAIHLPLLIKAPSGVLGGGAAPQTVGSPVASIDLAPTMLQLAGAKPCAAPGFCRTLDGRSLIPLLGGPGAWPANRAILAEYSANRPIRGTCAYAAVKTPAAIYIRHLAVGNPASAGRTCRPADIRERYNLRADPYELRNLCTAGTACPKDPLQARLEQTLRRLRRCAGIAGRDPRVKGRPFCE
jgi:N-acetylglucosamine-6-sulfatase